MRHRLIMACARNRSVSVALLTALLAGGLVGVDRADPVEASSAATPEPVDRTAAEVEALGAAKRAGAPVEVRGSKSEASRVLATPQGSLVLESYAVPRWTKGRDGAWRQIDTTLRATPDRRIAPVATLADVSFPTGGVDPAVRLSIDGGQVSLTWPDSLPAPRLEGDTAVYESVLPGVDLRLRALTDGFTWALVVKSAQAAANPALNEVRFGLATTGSLAKRSRTNGGFEVVDGSGKAVVSAGSAVMWDASGLPAPEKAAKGRAATTNAEQDRRDLFRAAPDRARKAELWTNLRGDELSIRPDPALLRGADTVYPVVIDPWTTINKTYWGYADSTNATRDDGVVRVGNNPDGSGNYRSFFRFNLSSLSGKTIRSAKFLTKMTHSWSCTNTPVNLWRTADLPSSGKQTWDGPNLALWLEERSGHAHKPSGGAGCSDDPQPDLPMEFSSTNLKNDISTYRGDTNYTLALSTRRSDGTSESTASWWKKFDAGATKLSVEYNTPPNTPTAAQLSTHAGYTAPAQACVTGTSRPMVRADYPWLKAVLTDPDGSNGGSLSGVFTLQKLVGTTWTTVTGWPKTDSGVAPGGKAEVQLTTKVANGDVYRWQVQTKDTLGGSSGASPWCEFYADYSPPEQKPMVTPADGIYLESPPLGTNQDVRGSVGYSGRFTFSANGAADVYDYVYQVNAGPEIVVKASTLGGSATAWVTPSSVGENVLSVRSRDQAGNASAPYEYTFLVDAPSGPKAHWAIDEGTGTSLNNSVDGAPTATLGGGATWTDGKVLGTHESLGKDWAVTFDGTDDHATATGVDIDTTRSYSIAAWVRPDGDGLMEIAGSPGTQTDSFMLRKWGDNRWVFTVIEDDVWSSPFTNIFGPVAVNGQWTHVAGVYDPAGGRMRLYVNGEEVASGTVPRTFDPGGKISLGRERWKGADVAYWKGAIGEVRLWDRVIDPDLDLQPLLKPVLVGNWDFENGDTTTRTEPDLSGYQRSLTVTEAPTADWTPEGYNYSTGLMVNGAPGSADVSEPVLRTDQSFGVAAWVKVTTADHQTIAAQDGSNRSAFYLMHDADYDRWSVTMPSVDVGTAQWQFVLSTELPQLGTWTHVAATYDAAARELRLYVNGVLQGVRPNTVSWHASSVLHLGRSKHDFFLNGGTVDDVRLWQGRVSEDEILAAMAGA